MEIKFRGVGRDGRVYYGDLIGGNIIRTKRGRSVRLIPCREVSQFVGYDSNGAEVYEGEGLIDAAGERYTARVIGVGSAGYRDKAVPVGRLRRDLV